MPFPSGVVAGPSVSNGFFLTFGRVSGNERRATVKGFYSGVSFNSEYGLNMIGSGVKTVKIRKKGRSNPRYVMKVVDSFNENAQVGGALYTGWRLSGTFTKR